MFSQSLEQAKREKEWAKEHDQCCMSPSECRNFDNNCEPGEKCNCREEIILRHKARIEITSIEIAISKMSTAYASKHQEIARALINTNLFLRAYLKSR